LQEAAVENVHGSDVLEVSSCGSWSVNVPLLLLLLLPG
jgi:hypothetical protein